MNTYIDSYGRYEIVFLVLFTVAQLLSHHPLIAKRQAVEFYIAVISP